MESLFETITKNLPKATEEQKRQLAELEPTPVQGVGYDKMPLKDLVAVWNKEPKEELTSLILQRLKPTINSAITSYAPGHSTDLAVKAAKLSLDALKTFDPTRGVDPSTHVFNNLKRLSRISNRRQNIIPISERRAMEFKLLQQAADKFADTFDREPSDMELADATGFSLKKVRKLLDGSPVASESSQVNPETHTSTSFASDVTDDDYYDYVYRSVGPIDQKIMEWSSGKYGRKPLNNKQIAEKLHMTPAAISQRSKKIMALMSEVRGLV